MNYQKIYNSLISRAKIRILTEYTESHHIIPKCMGGTDDVANLVKLTPEEHYVAHQLLVKIYPTNVALVMAAAMMIPNRPSNKMYGWLRRRHKHTISTIQSGEGNSQYGTRWIHNKSLKTSKKVTKLSNLPTGWEEGRILDFEAYFKKIEQQNSVNEQRLKSKLPTTEQRLKRIKTKHVVFRRTEGYRRAKTVRLYEEFKNSNMSLRKFAEHKNIIPMTLSKWFREFIDNYNIVARLAANKQIN